MVGNTQPILFHFSLFAQSSGYAMRCHDTATHPPWARMRIHGMTTNQVTRVVGSLDTQLPRFWSGQSIIGDGPALHQMACILPRCISE